MRRCVVFCALSIMTLKYSDYSTTNVTSEVFYPRK